jgi:transposase-like protein
MPDDASAEPIERWPAKRRVALVVSILKGETSVAEAARTHGLTVAEVEDWREKFLLGAENALRSRPRDEEALTEEQIKKLKQKIGDLVLDNDILREALKPYPLDRKTSDAGERRGRVSQNGAIAKSSRSVAPACIGQEGPGRDAEPRTRCGRISCVS